MDKSDLRKIINNIGWSIHKMSFIIGAGFSKNISNQYLSWWELMQGMVHELYGAEMKAKGMSVGDIISKYGYLGVASEYVRRKGYHESIDLYIEKRTPYLLKDKESKKGKFNLVLDGRIIEKDVDTSLHQSLLKLRPKSIYTFNYDNALECYSDFVKIPVPKEIKNEKLQVVNYLKSFLNDKYGNAEMQLKLAVDDLCNHPENTEAYLSRLEKAVRHFNIEIIAPLKELINIKEISLDEGDSVVRQCEAISEKIKDKIKYLKNELYEIDRNKYLLVTNSTQIAINTYENYIYKVHGTLRQFNEAKMSFNGDIDFDHDRHTQYIITKEDYDTYSEKHEAFVDLMRISLLRDDFCIIGFSCDDPNFLLWINWVKDINDKAKDRQSDISKKYYINVDDNALPEDKRLLLENHQIQILNLFDIYTFATTRKERLSEFFNDLSLNQNAFYLYERVWAESNLFVSKINGHNWPTYNKDDISLAWYNMLKNPVAFMDKAFDGRRADILLNFGRVVKDKMIDTDITRLGFMAANRGNVPFGSFLPDNKEIVESAFENVDDPGLDQLVSENNELQTLLEHGDCNITAFSPEKQYFYGLLKRFYCFDFSDIEDYISSWHPTYKIGKVLKLIYTGSISNKTIQTVRDLSDREGYTNPQEYYTSLLMLSLFRWALSYDLIQDKVFEDINNTIKDLNTNEKGLVNFHEYIYDLETRLHGDDTVSPLGDRSITIHFSSINKAEEAAIKMINFIAKTGLNPNFASVNIIDKNKWYLVVKNAYKYYPSACLLYSSTFSEKDLAVRIGQLYAYDSQLVSNSTISELLSRIMNACLLYPAQVNIESLLVYACYFMKVVPPEKWIKVFKDIFYKNEWYDKDVEYWHKNVRPFDFAYEGLAYIDDYDFKQDLASKILSKQERLTSYDNSLLLTCFRGKNISADNKEKISMLLKLKLTLPIAMIIINFRQVLPSRSFLKWLKQVPDEILNDKSLIVVFAKLAKGHRSLRPKLFDLVGKNSTLWNTGIVLDEEEQKVTQIGGFHTSYIENIERFISLPKNVTREIYTKAIKRLSEIDKAVRQRWINEMSEYWCMVLVSIRCFLVKHKAELSLEIDYWDSIDKCKKLYKDISGFSTVSEKLLSDKGYRVFSASMELQLLIRTDGIKIHETDIAILLSIVLNQNGESLDSSISLLMQLLIDYPAYFDETVYRQNLLLILRRYEPYYVRDEFWNLQAEKDQVEEFLLRVRNILMKKRVDVGSWKDYTPQFWRNKLFVDSQLKKHTNRK